MDNEEGELKEFRFGKHSLKTDIFKLQTRFEKLGFKSEVIEGVPFHELLFHFETKKEFQECIEKYLLWKEFRNRQNISHNKHLKNKNTSAKKWREKNKEKRSQWAKEYNRKNREEISRKQRERRAARKLQKQPEAANGQ